MITDSFCCTCRKSSAIMEFARAWNLALAGSGVSPRKHQELVLAR